MPITPPDITPADITPPDITPAGVTCIALLPFERGSVRIEPGALLVVGQIEADELVARGLAKLA